VDQRIFAFTVSVTMISVGKGMFFSQSLLAEEMRKSSLPDEGICTSYHIMRQSKKGFGSRRYSKTFECRSHSTFPQNSEADEIVSRLFVILDSIESMPQVEKDNLSALLTGDSDAEMQDFLYKMIQKVKPATSEALKAELCALLSGGGYNYVSTAKEAFGAATQQRPLHCVAPRSKSEADRVVSEMLAVFEYVDMFPAHYKKRLGQQLHCGEKGGSEAFLKEWVAAHSKPKSQNEYALMPEASPDLIAEVSSLLRDDDYFSFLMRVKCMIPTPQSSLGRARLRQFVARARCVIPRPHMGEGKAEEMSVFQSREVEVKERCSL